MNYFLSFNNEFPQRLLDIQARHLNVYHVDVNEISPMFSLLEGKARFKLVRQNAVLFTADLKPIDKDPSYEEFVRFALTYHGMVMVGPLILMDNVSVGSHLTELEMRSLAEIVSLLLTDTADHILVGEKEMADLPHPFQDQFIKAYGIYEERQFDYQNDRFWRCLDDAAPLPW